MKKLIIALIMLTALALSGCAQKPQSETPDVSPTSQVEANGGEDIAPADETPEVKSAAELYSEVFSLYKQAVSEKWGGGELTEKGMSLVMLDCYGENNIGYTYTDFDGDGKEEFAVALTESFTDDFYGKLLLDVYSTDAEGRVIQLISSGSRDRYYYAGEGLFANLGADDAAGEVNRTLKLEGLELHDTGSATEAENFKQLALERFS